MCIRDRLWNMSDQEFSDFAVDEIIKMGMIDSKDDVLDTHSESVKKAIPLTSTPTRKSIL